MAYVHTPASRTPSAAQAVDDARLVVRYDKAIIPPGELIQGLGQAVAAAPAASTGFNWSGLATTLAQTVLPAAVQVGASIYTARQAKKDLAKQEDLINAEAAAARQVMAQQQAMVAAQRQAPAGGISTNTVLLIGGVAVVGLLAVMLITRRQ
jgi:hypothetical protein